MSSPRCSSSSCLKPSCLKRNRLKRDGVQRIRRNLSVAKQGVPEQGVNIDQSRQDRDFSCRAPISLRLTAFDGSRLQLPATGSAGCRWQRPARPRQSFPARQTLNRFNLVGGVPTRDRETLPSFPTISITRFLTRLGNRFDSPPPMVDETVAISQHDASNTVIATWKNYLVPRLAQPGQAVQPRFPPPAASNPEPDLAPATARHTPVRPRGQFRPTSEAPLHLAAGLFSFLQPNHSQAQSLASPATPATLANLAALRARLFLLGYSHSIVAGGLLLMS